jgi:hypothetical protein
MAAPTFPIVLTQAQRKAVADSLPTFAARLKTDEPASRTVQFSLAELKKIVAKCKIEYPNARGMVRNSLRHVVDLAGEALKKYQEGGIARIPTSERLYQFKITLKDIEPPIWRRIQVKDCPLDKLHEQIQTAMGWKNSHLHKFMIDGVLYGDPQLLCEGRENEVMPVDSLMTRLNEIIPADGKPFQFEYEYDFGDGWEHEILFEGYLCAKKGVRYPLCVEGERACPPEDVGGTTGYAEYLEALADPKHREHASYMEWGGPFDPEAFDPQAVTRRMRRGIFDWRKAEEEEWLNKM